MGNKIDKIYNLVVFGYILLVLFFVFGCGKIEVDAKSSGEVIVRHVIDLHATAQDLIDLCNQIYTQNSNDDLQKCIEQQLTNLSDILKNLSQGNTP